MGRKGKGSQFIRHKERQHRLAREQKNVKLSLPHFKEPMKHYVPPAYVEFGNLITSVAEARKQPKNRARHVPLIIAEELTVALRGCEATKGGETPW